MQVPRTFVFVDISGFTNYTTTHGDAHTGVAGEVARDAAPVGQEFSCGRIAVGRGEVREPGDVDEHEGARYLHGAPHDRGWGGR